MAAKLKVRQPLAKVEIVLADETHRAWLESIDEAVRDELNVKEVEYTTHGEQYITYEIQPNLKRLGPRFGKQLSEVRKAISNEDASNLVKQLRGQVEAKSTVSGTLTVTKSIPLSIAGKQEEFEPDDFLIQMKAKSGWAAAQGKQCVVVLSTELTEELIQEGIAKDVVRAIQDRRKEIACEYTARIEVAIYGESESVRAAVAAFSEHIRGETLAVKLVVASKSPSGALEVAIADEKVWLAVKVVG
jgi:isoleucyl-tRNA synthetase